jgi:type I restriction enzyme, S subunit
MELKTEADSDVPQGYKRTEVGVIPEDWRVVKLGEVCKLINGRGFKPHEWRDRGLPIIRIQNLNGSGEFNFYEGTYDKKIEVLPGQLLFAWSGSRGTSFGPHIWRGELGILNYHTWKVSVNSFEADKLFMFHLLKQLTKEIEDDAHGASALVHTQKWEMEAFQIPLPPTKAEQEAIAGALSDADALIQSLEQLIAKKRLIKQGTLQELLTPPGEDVVENAWKTTPECSQSSPSPARQPTRLPGFSGKWQRCRLGEIAQLYQPQTISADKFTQEGYPVYGANGFIGFFNKYNHDTWQIAITCRGSTCGTVNRVPGKSWITGNAMVANCGNNDGIVKEYLYYALKGTDLTDCITGSGQPQIVRGPLFRVSVAIPPTKAEQTAIAAVLSEMDDEIEALESKLSKARLLKQGMMQELLTGRIRLVKG